MTMNRALLVLCAVASLAGCSSPVDPGSPILISVNPQKAEQMLTITNNSDERVFYSHHVEDGITDYSLCGDGTFCNSLAPHTWVSIRYTDIPEFRPGSRTMAFFYWRYIRVFNQPFATADAIHSEFVTLQ